MTGCRQSGTHLADGTYQVRSPTITAGFVVRRGRVVECDPILRRRLDYWLIPKRQSSASTFGGRHSLIVALS